MQILVIETFKIKYNISLQILNCQFILNMAHDYNLNHSSCFNIPLTHHVFNGTKSITLLGSKASQVLAPRVKKKESTIQSSYKEMSSWESDHVDV